MLIQNGPYLQEMQKNSLAILWETDEISSGQVTVYSALHPHAPVSRPSAGEEIGSFYTQAGTFHRAVVDGLAAGTDYYYKVTSQNEKGSVSTRMFSFRTAPEETAAISFVLTSEHGGMWEEGIPFTEPIIRRIRRERPDFVQSLGDILNDGRDPSQWNFFLFRPFHDLLCSTPFYPCVGNHEVGSNAVKDAQMDAHYANYEKYFPIGRNYSYDYGCAHFCVLDCPSMFEEIRGSATDTYLPVLKDDFENHEAYRFLEQDLAQSNARWKFVVFHYPPYTSSMYDVPEMRIFTPLFEKYGVDIVFNSHAIVYERSYPIKAGKLDRNGVRYILTGGYGDFDHWFWDKGNGYTAKLAARPGYVRVALTPWSLELQAIDYEGKLFDTLTLEKSL